jgi:hypothetical protein
MWLHDYRDVRFAPGRNRSAKQGTRWGRFIRKAGNQEKDHTAAGSTFLPFLISRFDAWLPSRQCGVSEMTLHNGLHRNAREDAQEAQGGQS